MFKSAINKGFAFAAALFLFCSLAAQAAPTWVQSRNNTCIAATCTSAAFVGAATAGDYILVTVTWANPTAVALTNCTYNGSNITIDYDSGPITSTGVVEAAMGHATALASTIVGTCNLAAAVTSMTVVTNDITAATFVANHANTCNTSGCSPSLAHSTLTSGNLAAGTYVQDEAASFAGCGTGWTRQNNFTCQGTDTSANTFSYTAAATFGGIVAVEDLSGGSSSPTGTSIQPGAGVQPGGMPPYYGLIDSIPGFWLV